MLVQCISVCRHVSFVLKRVVAASCSHVKSHTNGGSMNLNVHQHNESNNRELKTFWHFVYL